MLQARLAATSVEEIRQEVKEIEQGLEFSNRAIDTMNDKVDDLNHVEIPIENAKKKSQTGMKFCLASLL